ncbi:PREDICTED: proteasome subunit alpha type-7 [Colobus angolensis palliatus]|nr:PREDICTED: proteasome subunit alpha type-7 [Colobus angolensis palliatus]
MAMDHAGEQRNRIWQAGTDGGYRTSLTHQLSFPEPSLSCSVLAPKVSKPTLQTPLMEANGTLQTFPQLWKISHAEDVPTALATRDVCVHLIHVLTLPFLFDTTLDLRWFPAVGVRGRDIVVLGVEKKSVAKLQDERTVRKICALDDNVCMAFAGLTADARIVINRARVECQSHRLTVEDPVTVEYITRYIASLKQRYTQSNGRRPFGISALIVGFDFDGTPRLYQTDPSGTYHAWKANAIGRGAKSVREFLEKNYTDEAIETDDLTIKLVIKALLEVVQSGGKNIELAIMRRDQPLKILNPEEIEKYVAEIEKEKEENEKKKQKKAS